MGKTQGEFYFNKAEIQKQNQSSNTRAKQSSKVQIKKSKFGSNMENLKPKHTTRGLETDRSRNRNMNRNMNRDMRQTDSDNDRTKTRGKAETQNTNTNEQTWNRCGDERDEHTRTHARHNTTARRSQTGAHGRPSKRVMEPQIKDTTRDDTKTQITYKKPKTRHKNTTQRTWIQSHDIFNLTDVTF